MMRALGIDPGSRYTGYGIIEARGNRLTHIAAGRIVAQGKGDFTARLEIIYDGLAEVIAKYKPTHAAIEGIFHHRNAQSALKLGHARGVALLACRHHQLELEEYAPSVVKKAVVGTGRADKQQVQQMVSMMLGIRATDLAIDASDALAIAICLAHHRRTAHLMR